MTYPKGYTPPDGTKSPPDGTNSRLGFQIMKLPSRDLVLLLLVAPFVAALINGAIIYALVIFVYPHPELTSFAGIGGLVIIFVAIFDGILVSSTIGDKIYNKPQTELVKSVESAVEDLHYARIFFYILIFVVLGVTAFFIFNAIYEEFGHSSRLLNLSVPVIVSLSGAVITIVVAVIAMGERLVRKDFQYYIAKMSVQVVDKTKKDEDKRMRFLGIVLNSYDRFLQKKLRVEFDTTKVFSMILTDKKKNTKINEIVDSFNEDDKFKPVASLSGSVKDSEPFLVKKRIWTTVKEAGTFLAVIIPVLIAVVQLIQSFYKI